MQKSLMNLSSCLLIAIAAAANPFVVQAQTASKQDVRKESVCRFNLSQTRADAIYKPGETFSFFLSLEQDGKPLVGKTIRYKLRNEEGKPDVSGTIRSSEKPFELRTSILKPGFVLLELSAWDEANKKPLTFKNKQGRNESLRALAGAGCEPLKIRSGIPEPADFDAFWNARKAELAKVPVSAKRTPVKIGNKSLQDVADLYDVEIACPGSSTPVRGYLGIPKHAKAKGHPIVLSLHGAGTRSSGVPWLAGGERAIAMDINAHGVLNGQPEAFYRNLAKTSLKDYWYIGNDDRNRNYFTGMYMRLMRTLQYLKSLPEWDGKNLIVTGGSQGGAQALAAAGLDGDVSFCIAVVPWLCNFTGVTEGRIPPYWPTWIPMKNGKPVNPKLAAELPYVDSALMAKRIRCETVVTVGFIDYGACPPSGVYTAFNNIPHGKKTMRPFPVGGHGGTNANGVLGGHLKKIAK